MPIDICKALHIHDIISKKWSLDISMSLSTREAKCFNDLKEALPKITNEFESNYDRIESCSKSVILPDSGSASTTTTRTAECRLIYCVISDTC